MINLQEFQETMEKVEKAEYWNDFDVKTYEDLCEFAGLDYHTYDDPDAMWNDLCDFARSQHISAGSCRIFACRGMRVMR